MLGLTAAKGWWKTSLAVMFCDTVIYQISMGVVLLPFNNYRQCWIVCIQIVPPVDGHDIFQNCVENDGDESNTVLYALDCLNAEGLMGFQWGPWWKLSHFDKILKQTLAIFHMSIL